MSRRNTNKKSRNSYQETNDEDHITKLPNDIKSRILSSLPAKDAVRTSVLSKDWEYAWTSIYKIDIKDRQRFTKWKRKNSSFVNFMERIFYLLDELKSVHLKCVETYDTNRLTGWISSVLKRNIDHFELILYRQKGVVLPCSLLNKTSLRILKLVLSCTFKVPLNNYFPNLTCLCLMGVEILSLISSGDLVFTFPVLETLELRYCKWSNVNLLEIHSPSLRKFACRTTVNTKVHVFAIKIFGARIEEFESSGGFPEDTILHKSVVLNATFQNDPLQKEYETENDNDLHRGLQVRKLLTKFSCVTGLVLSVSMSEAVALSKQELSLPRFDKLQRLVMFLIDTKLLFELLHIANLLKFLKIYGRHKKHDCDEVYPVPGCVTSHLEEINLVNVGNEILIHLAKFFLKNALKLKKVSLGGYAPERAKIANLLLKSPIASACLAIVS